MSYAQNWNNVLSFVKIELGIPTNLLEIADNELIKLYKEHILSLFAQYSPAKNYAYITEANRLIKSAGSPQFMYKIPVPLGTYIVDILEAYPTRESSIVDMYGGSLIDSRSAMDLVIANSYIDAVRSLQVRNTWEFLPPDIMIFDKEIYACVVIYNTTHDVLNTIRPDLYHQLFKPLCLAYTKIWLAAQRSKFDNLSTPFGQLNLNWETLKSEGQTEKDNIIQELKALPPDILIEIS